MCDQCTRWADYPGIVWRGNFVAEFALLIRFTLWVWTENQASHASVLGTILSVCSGFRGHVSLSVCVCYFVACQLLFGVSLVATCGQSSWVGPTYHFFNMIPISFRIIKVGLGFGSCKSC